MKKLLSKINYKVIGIIAGVTIFECMIFFLTKFFLRTPHLVGSSFDDRIPFLPGFIYIYILWYFSLIVIPYYVYIKDKSSFFKYVVAIIISLVMCGIIYVIYPNSITRAEVTGTDLSSKLVKLIYFLDTPVNCLPSIHCLYAYMFIFAIFDTKNESKLYIKIIITIFSIAVVFSTLFVKQHVIYDALAALIISIISWIIADQLKLYKLFSKKLNLDN